jgi:hypothetical protein
VGFLFESPHIETFKGRGDVTGEKDLKKEGEKVLYESVIL